MTTKAEIAGILTRMRAQFPNYNPPDMQLAAEAWLEIVGHIPGDQLRAAVLECISEPGRIWAPSVGEVLGALVRIQARANAVPSAVEAWEQVINWRSGGRVVRLCARGQSLYARNGYTEHLQECGECFDGVAEASEIHPLARRVAEALGWPDTFPGMSDDRMADRAHYLKAYALALQDAQRDAVMTPEVAQMQAKIQAAAANVTRRLGGG